MFRTSLAGPGHTLMDVFSRLEHGKAITNVRTHAGRDLFGARVALGTDEGEGYLDFTRIRDDIFLVIENFSYNDSRFEISPSDDLVQFYFKLSGDLTMDVSKDKRLHLSRPSLLISHLPQGAQFTQSLAPRAHERSVALNVRPSFLADTFLLPDANEPNRLDSLFRNPASSSIQHCLLPLTAEMFALATKLVDQKLEGPLGLVNAEGMALQLLCTAVASIGALLDETNEEYTDRELRCLQAARVLVVNRIANPPTIKQVARAAGLNENTLKRGFKQLFGTTIFDLSVRIRMEHALVMLRERKKPVAEVATAVGYTHQTSFATAFRRHFGVSPRSVQRSRKR